MGSDGTLDAHGQPRNRAFNARRIKDRGVDERIEPNGFVLSN